MKGKHPSIAKLSAVALDALERVARAADRVASLEPRLRRAREDLHAAIIESREAGVSEVVIARAAKLSRQRVSQLLKKQQR